MTASKTTNRLSLAALSLALLGAAACGSDDPTDAGPPLLAQVAGSYSASGAFGAVTFVTTDTTAYDDLPGLAECGIGGETIDWLEVGASLEIELHADGTTTGRLFVPCAHEDGGDMDEDLAGTWSLAGDVVTFDHEADTFVRDMDFVYADGRLTGQEDFGDVFMEVVLVKE